VRASERVFRLGGDFAAALRERRRNQRVEPLDQEEAPEREPGAAGSLRGPGRERGAEQRQAEIRERGQQARVVVQRADEPHEPDVQQQVRDERHADEPRDARDDAPADDCRDAADALPAAADHVQHVGEAQQRDHRTERRAAAEPRREGREQGGAGDAEHERSA
jgi:hypothetical protein